MKASDGKIPSIPSPVVRADSKFFGAPPFLCVDVRFESMAQLDELIAALSRLREQSECGFNHVHLQDLERKSGAKAAAGAEVTFWHPSVQRSETEETCVAEALEAILSKL